MHSPQALFCLVAVIIALSQGVAAKGIYRGVATDSWAGGCNDLTALSRMSWYYNWGLTPPSNVADCDLGNRYVEYVPMVWGGAAADSFNASQLPSGTKHLMAFNEPNGIVGQANLTPEEATVEWRKVLTKLDNAGLLGKIKLGAPSASPGGTTDPKIWFTWFFGNCTDCKFDFLCFHIYDCNAPYYNAGSLNYWLDQVSGFDLPIWLTEFACPSGPGTDVSLKNETTFMQNALWALDNNTLVERYSWFTARATNVGVLPSLFNSTTNQLTEVGQLYNSQGDSLSNDPSSASGLAPFTLPNLLRSLFPVLA